jgi:hypothetical protein
MFVSQTSKMDLGRPVMKTESIERFIEVQAFLRSYDLPRGKRSQIIRPRESLASINHSILSQFIEKHIYDEINSPEAEFVVIQFTCI